MQYRAVIFDLFGTLVPPFPGVRFDELLMEMSSIVEAEPSEFVRLWTKETWHARATGIFPTIESNILHICSTLGITPSDRQLSSAARVRHEFSRDTLKPRADAVDTLRALDCLGLSRGLISDCSSEVPLLWPESSLAPHIDHPIFSCTARLKKPDPAIYRLACERLGIEPERCLYVGDGSSRELTGAADIGMTAVLIAPPDEAGEPGSERHSWEGRRVESLTEVVGIVELASAL